MLQGVKFFTFSLEVKSKILPCFLHNKKEVITIFQNKAIVQCSMITYFSLLWKYFRIDEKIKKEFQHLCKKRKKIQNLK